MQALYALLQGLCAAGVREAARRLVQAFFARQGLQDARRAAEPVSAVLLPVDDRRRSAGGLAARPRQIRAVDLPAERLRLWPGRSGLARSVAQGAVLRGVGAQPEIGGQRWPSRRFQASLRETGMPRAVMRLSTLQPTLASTFCAGRVRARSVRPMMVL